MKYTKYTVTFSSDGIPDVIVLLDENPPQPSGYGGWQVTAREHRIGLTQWRGNDPVRIAIPVLFDRAMNKVCDQDKAIRNLMLMGTPPALDQGEPPVITVTGVGITPVTPKGDKQKWVMESITWGTNRDVSDDGTVKRQDAIVNLIQYVAEDRVAFANIKMPSINPGKNGNGKGSSGKSSSGGNWPKWYTVLPGDTLPKIAAKFYHNSNKWRRIAEANNIRDPRLFGTWLFKKIRIPAP